MWCVYGQYVVCVYNVTCVISVRVSLFIRCAAICRLFGSSETLCSEYKYYCECCCSKQEATKRLRVKKLPTVLALHLKRFKYVEQLRRHTKLSHRVVFPWELKLFNTVIEGRGWGLSNRVWIIKSTYPFCSYWV